MRWLEIYLIFCAVWSVIAFYKQRTSYKAPLNNWMGCFTTALLNFAIAPIALVIAIKNKKL